MKKIKVKPAEGIVVLDMAGKKILGERRVPNNSFYRRLVKEKALVLVEAKPEQAEKKKPTKKDK